MGMKKTLARRAKYEAEADLGPEERAWRAALFEFLDIAKELKRALKLTKKYGPREDIPRIHDMMVRNLARMPEINRLRRAVMRSRLRASVITGVKQ